MKKNYINFREIDQKDGFFITTYVSDGTVAANYDVFYIATKPCEVLIVAETHRTKGTAVGSVTLNIEKLTSGQALDAGATLLATGFDLKGDNNTPVIKQGLDLTTSRTLDVGDRLALKDAGTLTSLAGIQVTLYLKRLGKGDYE